MGKIRDFIFKKKEEPVTDWDLIGGMKGGNDDISNNDNISEALAYYCARCKRGFKTKGARNAHNALKHKEKNEPR